MHHKNIIYSREIFEDKKYIYIVFDLCNGGCLKSYLKKHKCSESETKYLMK